MFDPVQFGARLRQARDRTGMSGDEVAMCLQTSEGSVSRYERGLVEPGINRVYEFAKLYNVSIDWLCGLDGGKKDDPV